MFTRFSVAALGILAAVASIGCRRSGSSTSNEGAAASDLTTPPDCRAEIESKVLDQARAIDKAATIKTSTKLYASSDYTVWLSHVSDATDSSDYISFDKRSETSCKQIEDVQVMNDVLLPAETPGHDNIGDDCWQEIEHAVMGKWDIIVTGTKVLYGSPLTGGSGLVLVRTSTEDGVVDKAVRYEVTDHSGVVASTCEVSSIKDLQYLNWDDVDAGQRLPDVDGLLAWPH